MTFKLNMSNIQITDDRYKDGKIYKIISDKTDMIYIGSTIRTLNKRLRDHKSHNNTKPTRSKQIFDIDPNPKIVLLENYPCKNKKELEIRERYYIENNNCINKSIPTRTHKEYYLINKEKIKEEMKEYLANRKPSSRPY